MAIAFFDLDRTLIDVNSGELWVRSEWKLGRLATREVMWAAWWLARYKFGHGKGLDLVFQRAALGLVGQREDELADRVRAWFELEVAHHLRPGGRVALDKHREQGDRLVLATSGTYYAATAAAHAFGIETVVSTELEVAEGLFTGQIRTLAVGDGKLTAVASWAEREGVDFEDATFYSDSFTDVALLEAVREPVVVNPDRKLRRHAALRGWPIVDWGLAPRA